MAVYAVSDIHGYYDLFLKGLSEIHFSEGDFLWCLEDMIDRGPDGIKLLEHIMNHDNMDLLIGNHELMFLNSVDESGKTICNGKDAYLWLDANGGKTTFYQYKKLAENDRNKLLDWLRKRFVVRRENIVNIDGGCAKGNVENINNGAIFLRLNDMTEYVVQF